MKVRLSTLIFLATVSGCKPAPDPAIAAQSKAETLLREHFKDPESAKFSGVSITRVFNNYVMCGDVNAKNSFGGYVGKHRFFVIYYPEKNGITTPHIATDDDSRPIDARCMAAAQYSKSHSEFIGKPSNQKQLEDFVTYLDAAAVNSVTSKSSTCNFDPKTPPADAAESASRAACAAADEATKEAARQASAH